MRFSSSNFAASKAAYVQQSCGPGWAGCIWKMSLLDFEAELDLAGPGGAWYKETQGAIREFGGSKELREHVRGLVDRSDPGSLTARPSPSATGSPWVLPT